MQLPHLGGMLLELPDLCLQVQGHVRGQLPLAPQLRTRGVRCSAGDLLHGPQLLAQPRSHLVCPADSCLRTVSSLSGGQCLSPARHSTTRDGEQSLRSATLDGRRASEL